MKFDIKIRWTGSVIFTAEIDCNECTTERVKLGLAVRKAVAGRVNLAGADLAGAHLYRADLSGDNLAGADLAGANLADADLAGANLAGADLAGAHLYRADLSGVNLTGANLTGANLADADLEGANLAGADLAGAKWRDDIIIQRAPLQIYGLRYPVTILDEHMQIGCELHTLADWAAFDDRRIARMGDAAAVRFWTAHKVALLSLAASDGRETRGGADD